jgi:proline racemase
MQTYQVIDTHTAGHPTRVIVSGVPPLKGSSVRARRDDFKARFDGLRTRLLHEPRGHSAMVGAVLTDSAEADFGAFFISSYVYLDMCGHGTIGLTRTLAATGQIQVARQPVRFSLETPAGVVVVDAQAAEDGCMGASILNVAATVEPEEITVEVRELGKVSAVLANCGGRFALVDAAAQNWPGDRDHVGDMCRRGAAIKNAVNAAVQDPVGSVLFYWDMARGHARHLVVLEGNKFDRSPCGTGTSARLAALHAQGRIDLEEPFIAESVLGTRYHCRLEAADNEIRPRICGQAHLTAFSTLVVEDSDPLADGFLCR